MNQTFQIWDKQLWYAQEKTLNVSFKSIDQQIFNGNWNLSWRVELHKFVIIFFIIEINNVIQICFVEISTFDFSSFFKILFFFWVLYYMFAHATQPITFHFQRV